MSAEEVGFNVAMGAVVVALVFCLRRNPTLLRGSFCAGSLLIVAASAAFLVESNEFGQMRLWAYAIFVHGVVLALAVSLTFHRASQRSLAAVSGAVCIGVLLTGIDAFLVEPEWLETSIVRIETRKLNHPIRIAIVADVQTDGIRNYELEVMRRIEESRADIVLFAGDYVQVPADEYSQVSLVFHALLRELRAKTDGDFYAVRGDVDHETRWPELFHGLGAFIFRDTGSAIRGPLLITGLGREASADPNLIIHADSRYHVVFGHRPDFARGRVEGDLLIAGHTHGGQVRLPFLGPVTTRSSIPRDWAAGVTDLGGGRTLIVSRGIGMERQRAPRLRFLCRPELVIVDLVPMGNRREME